MEICSSSADIGTVLNCVQAFSATICAASPCRETPSARAGFLNQRQWKENFRIRRLYVVHTLNIHEACETPWPSWWADAQTLRLSWRSVAATEQTHLWPGSQCAEPPGSSAASSAHKYKCQQPAKKKKKKNETGKNPSYWSGIWSLLHQAWWPVCNNTPGYYLNFKLTLQETIALKLSV